ncbi:hypothetical protein DFH08DRAFT_938652 [Mycena albidolilacea]|uniref:Uncharacterized protein n=1 Tax=Mycena albidolilacea TaxID=1033008 RepID=A0AAD7ENG5_9AGAR|nr:hypothetical protein DFH08DRAFT_938652 [Mycena albidolilacea]
MQLHVDLLTKRLTKKKKKARRSEIRSQAGSRGCGSNVEEEIRKIVSHNGYWKVSKRSKAGTIQGKGLDAPNAFRMTLETTIYFVHCNHCPDGKGRVDCCEALWPFGQTERLRGLAAGFDIGGDGGRQSSWRTTTAITKRKHSYGGTPKPLGTLLRVCGVGSVATQGVSKISDGGRIQAIRENEIRMWGRIKEGGNKGVKKQTDITYLATRLLRSNHSALSRHTKPIRTQQCSKAGTHYEYDCDSSDRCEAENSKPMVPKK